MNGNVKLLATIVAAFACGYWAAVTAVFVYHWIAGTQ